MIFLDSWIWLEFFTEGEKQTEADKILESVNKNLTAATSAAALTEIKYIIAKRFGIERSETVLQIIENMPNLSIVPVSSGAAKLAADLRLKYYKKSIREISYIDAINLAIALLTNCNKFYTGDPEFRGIKEIEVVIV